MKIKKGFVLRRIGDKEVVIGEGLEQVNFNKIVALNATAANLWKQLEGKDFTEQEVASLLEKEYEIDASVAEKDAKDIIARWTEVGLIE